MVDSSEEKKSGCGLLNVVFGRSTFWLRRSTSTGSIPTPNSDGSSTVKTPTTPNSQGQRGSSDETAFLDLCNNGSERHLKPISGPSPKTHGMYPQSQIHPGTRVPGGPIANMPSDQRHVNQGRRVPRESIGISGELESMIADHQKSRGRGTFVRASSSNVMLFGNLGNLRQPGTSHASPNDDMFNHLPRPTAREETAVPTERHTSTRTASKEPPSSFCRALSTRMDPETLKILGNEDYKSGRFTEALALYDAAISIDPNKASYRSNKSAALTALGRLLEAIIECREAIRIEPHYHRAHNRAATLYLRLGEAEKAMYHYKHAGPEADPEVIAKARAVQTHLNKCTEAQRLRDWNSLIRESGRAISAGADSAPQIFSLQAEAFLKLNRHQEADEVLINGPNFEVDDCTKFLGPIGSSYLLMIRAQVDMAAGRFDDALEAAQRAARLDSNNKEANMVMMRARAVAAARSRGNELFRASRFTEACSAYAGGLEHDRFNSVLLCNRAACWSKLGELEKAIEDCTAALSVRPSYSKARLRRADCHAKLRSWEASVRDYEVLNKETPDDEEVSRALSEAQSQLDRQRGDAD
ncbi:inactive TPR repeat-containing thioredoxin TTL3 [Eucalyptus grandis]|uniref:inactive TPR repeat-containing thioredoxin TTL3 n=1 Tax=Eucalyptus grandis TaxID=71139 RepID=UPI00192EEEE0|nr:inactive TPR repeat-containing thioredoxin TTL3 [Eucalyptus grandis]